MAKYTIIVDTSFNISQEEIKKYDIEIISIHAYLDKQELNVDLTEEEFYEKFFNTLDADVKTAAPSQGQIIGKINLALKKCENVLILTTSSKLSSTYQNAKLVAKNFKNVKVIDSKGAFAKTKMMFDYLASNMNSNLSLDEIINNVKIIRDNTKIYFIINDLKYLYKNGRLNKAQAMLGEMLSIKPVLEATNNGEIGIVKKVRTLSKAVDLLIDFVKNGKEIDECYLSTLDDVFTLDMFVKKYENLNLKPKLNYTQKLPAVVGVHSGPKVFIICFLDKFNTFLSKEK